MTSFEASDRFLRPDDLRLIRRNRRQIQAERLLAIGGRMLFGLLVALLVYWIYERTHQAERFAVHSVEMIGMQHTSKHALDKITRAYLGTNLFKLDINRVQNELGKLPWVERVAIEKKLPSTLKITVIERRPVALASIGGALRYVDARGVAFAELSPAVGNPDLPVISAGEAQIEDCVRILSALRGQQPALFSRISEISPAGEDGFRVFDRDLKTFLYIGSDGAAEKWKTLYAIAAAEDLRRNRLEYVDLRFAKRIIVKPVQRSAPGAQRSETSSNVLPSAGRRAPSADGVTR